MRSVHVLSDCHRHSLHKVMCICSVTVFCPFAPPHCFHLHFLLHLLVARGCLCCVFPLSVCRVETSGRCGGLPMMSWPIKGSLSSSVVWPVWAWLLSSTRFWAFFKYFIFCCFLFSSFFGFIFGINYFNEWLFWVDLLCAWPPHLCYAALSLVVCNSRYIRLYSQHWELKYQKQLHFLYLLELFIDTFPVCSFYLFIYLS